MNKEILKTKIEDINNVIYGFIPESGQFDEFITEAVAYSVTAGGKRLRPMLMQEAFLMCAGKNRNDYCLNAFMAAMEFIHTYSLVHDDLSAMDNANYRRGKLTTHVKFGEAFGVLAGDALLNAAYEIVSKAMLKCKNENELSSCVKAFAILSEKAGIKGMVGGQCLDVKSEKTDGFSLGLNELDYIYENKTAALIEASLMIGAALAGAKADIIKTMESIGSCLGKAFQIEDDILDVTGNTEKLGKDTGADEKNHKNTFVDFYGVEGAKKEAEKLTDEAVRKFDSLAPLKNEFLKELILVLPGRQY